MLEELFTRKNFIGLLLKISGVIVMVWGVFQGFIILAEFSTEYGEIPIVALTAFFTPILMGLVIIGFGEVLDLLQELADKGKPKAELEKSRSKKDSAPLPQTIPLFDEADLKAFYLGKGIKIETITATKRRDVFVVESNGKVDYVELGGFSPRILSESEVEEFMA